jgi:Holliday junction resolvase RusA-like endonuclease
MKLTLKTTPTPINRKYGVYRGRMILSEEYRNTKEALGYEIKAQKASLGHTEPYSVPLSVTIIQYFGNKRKNDIDSCEKILLDSMNGIVYVDDSQIVEKHTYKRYEKGNAHVEIEVFPCTNN